MKKKILIVMTLVLLIILCSCSSGNTAVSQSKTAESVPQTEENYSEATANENNEAAKSDGLGGISLDKEEANMVGNNESYLTIDENKEKYTEDGTLVTFSLKVDTSSYTNTVRYIESGNLPHADAVKTEEFINYFSYDEKMEIDKGPFALSAEVGKSPFDENKKMAFLRVKTEDIDKDELPPSNLVFLIDTSGSMDSYDKLPLLKEAFSLLTETLDEDDRVSIVTYAGSSAVVLDSATGEDKQRILKAINTLEAGGSTAGADGIMTAYKLAEKNFIKDGNNRIMLASDGDFNVGISDLDELENLVAEKRDNGVYMSILGFGTGNLRDDIMETLSKNGNGNYSYIDSVSTAKKVLIDELGTNLFTVADDVKAQVEFNPETVKSYRLIGYENRALKNEDFEDDKKDAGEVGAGTDIVAMFEIELQGSGSDSGLKYSSEEDKKEPAYADELFELRIRYKDPGQSESKLIELPVGVKDIKGNNSSDYNFACSVAGFAHILRASDYAGDITIDRVIELAKDSVGEDKGGYRTEYIGTLEKCRDLMNRGVE